MIDLRWLKSLYLQQYQAVTRTGVAADLATQHLYNCFTVTGECVVTAVIGKVVSVKDATAQTLELGFTPTAGTGRIILGIASATTTGDVANKYYTWSGVIGSAILVAQTGDVIGVGAVGSVLAGTSGVKNILPPGVIDITTAAANDTLGLINWTVLYKPMTMNSKITVL